MTDADRRDTTVDCEHLTGRAADLTAEATGHTITIRNLGPSFPAPYLRFSVVDVAGPEDWPQGLGDDPDAGKLHRFDPRGQIRVVLPGWDDDTIGAVLVLGNFGVARALGEALLAVADREDEMHDPGLILDHWGPAEPASGQEREPGSGHWLASYDPGSGGPSGSICHCERDGDHDGAGNPL